MRLTAITAAFALTATAAFAADKTLDIGVSDALTGGGAVYGLPQANAVNLAAKEINAAGGIKVGADTYMLNVIAYDDKANPTEASNAVRKLIDRDGVKFILGFCCSGATGAVASFIENEDAVMLVGNAAERSITTGVESGWGRNRIISLFDHDFGHLYSPVSKICAHPRGEMCDRSSGAQPNPELCLC